MIKIEIKNRWTGSIIFSWECEKNTIAKTVKEYIRQEIYVKEKYRANLTDANLLRFKSDFFRVLLIAKKEIPFLKQSLIDGKIKGTAYEGA